VWVSASSLPNFNSNSFSDVLKLPPKVPIQKKLLEGMSS